ncbi:hypothetical protein [Nocardia australiensis]|uniref:hypothetical protein n=1 Tax=Nocardia australiensis TaxID=2887191 RepID=UPI001D13311C|nr:hypothetical protein [Nocardia australiensis]
MRLWTLQAPEVVAAVRHEGRYLAEWDRVVVNCRPAFRAVVSEMERRDIDCHSAPPVWCWPGRALRRNSIRHTANALLGDDQWARGVWLLKLDVPESVTLTTSYSRWNDYLDVTMRMLRDKGISDGPAFAAAAAPMDWGAELDSKWDRPQVVIPEVRDEWVLRARPFPPDDETSARIAADPLLRVRD